MPRLATTALLFLSIGLFAPANASPSPSPNVAGDIPVFHHGLPHDGPQNIMGFAPDDYLVPQNVVRAAHDAAPLTWSPTLAQSAKTWADMCNFTYSGSGENIAAGTGKFGPLDAVRMWAEEAG